MFLSLLDCSSHVANSLSKFLPKTSQNYNLPWGKPDLGQCNRTAFTMHHCTIINVLWTGPCRWVQLCRKANMHVSNLFYFVLLVHRLCIDFKRFRERVIAGLSYSWWQDCAITMTEEMESLCPGAFPSFTDGTGLDVGYDIFSPQYPSRKTMLSICFRKR